MAAEKKACPTCGASMVEYRHGLSRALVEGLDRIARRGKPINLKHLELSRNQWDNFQKLRYWDLVAKHDDGKGGRKGGVWKTTSKGMDFLAGRIRVPRQVVTYRGERVRYEEGDEIAVSEVIEGYAWKGDYADQAKPKGRPAGDRDAGQLALWG